MDRDRLWFKARVGVDVAEIERAVTFCAHTLRMPGPLLVADALTDGRFARDPLIIREPALRFYAGMPLVTPDGHAIGTLSVIDRVPRQLTDEQTEALAMLARQGIEPGRGIGALVLTSGRPFRTNDYAGDARIRSDFVDVVSDEGPVTAMAVPSRLAERVDGVLYTYNRSPRPFGDRDEAVLLRLAEHAAVAIQNAGLFAREQKARATVEASEQRFRGLFDGVPVGLLRATPAGRMTDANPALVQMLGYPDRESLLAVNVMDLHVDPAERARFRALLERDGVVRGFAARMRWRDGTVIWVEDNIKAVPDATDGVVY